MPKFSVIMQCFLGEYKGAASNRNDKLVRAIDSVLTQSFRDWELVVVADGCEKTFEIVEANYSKENNVECFLVSKQAMWSGSCRNFGISKANGEWIVYLDGDDYFGKDHLKKIEDQIGAQHDLVTPYQWMWFNDLVKTKNGIIERTALIHQRHQHGTANICHRRSMDVKWDMAGYGHDDRGFVQNLIRISTNYEKINTPEYVVCHIPGKTDY